MGELLGILGFLTILFTIGALIKPEPLLCAFGLDEKTEEYEIGKGIMDRLNNSALTLGDLAVIRAAQPIRPVRFYNDYLWEEYYKDKDEPWREFPAIIPFAIIDSRVRDLATSFWEDPDKKLMDGYRRLEDILREQTGLKDFGVALFNKVFLKEKLLTWKGADAGECVGRAQLFVGAYQAHRNPRAHHEDRHHDPEQLSEFLLLNHLYKLQSEAILVA